MALPTQTAPRHYAVAIRDPELYLALRISRSASGVYVIFPRPQNPIGGTKRNPHASYHRDGRRHQKSWGMPWFKAQRQPLDNHFRGSETIVATVLQPSHPQDPHCDPKDFSAVLEIPLTDIRPNGSTSVSVDLAEPGVSPTSLLPGAVIVRQQAYADGWFPCLVVTIYDSPTSS